MSWYHLSYDATGTDRNPKACAVARSALLGIFRDVLGVQAARLHRPTESALIFFTERSYSEVCSALNQWSDNNKTLYVLSMISVNAQGKNFCVWNPNATLNANIQAEYLELITSSNSMTDEGRSQDKILSKNRRTVPNHSIY